MANPISTFTLTAGEDGFTLRIEDTAGQVLEVLATDEQLDVLSEEIDRVLEENAVYESFDDEDGDDTDNADDD
jgi:hypothetical protein